MDRGAGFVECGELLKVFEEVIEWAHATEKVVSTTLVCAHYPDS